MSRERSKFLRSTDNFLFILQPDYSIHVLLNSNTFLVISDDQTDANDARRICSSAGGNLAQITNDERTQNLTNFLKKQLIESGK